MLLLDEREEAGIGAIAGDEIAPQPGGIGLQEADVLVGHELRQTSVEVRVIGQVAEAAVEERPQVRADRRDRDARVRAEEGGNQRLAAAVGSPDEDRTAAWSAAHGRGSV